MRSVFRATRDSQRSQVSRGTTASRSETWYQSSTSTEKALRAPFALVTPAAVASLAAEARRAPLDARGEAFLQVRAHADAPVEGVEVLAREVAAEGALRERLDGAHRQRCVARDAPREGVDRRAQ